MSNTPFGQQIRRPRRVVVLIEDETGKQHGWEIFNGRAEYDITGYPGGSAHGRVSVEGEFHRMAREGSLAEQQRYRAAVGTPSLQLKGDNDD